MTSASRTRPRAQTPIHDKTDQYKAFTYLSYVLDDTSRISVMGSASYADFQVPNTPGLARRAKCPTASDWNQCHVRHQFRFHRC